MAETQPVAPTVGRIVHYRAYGTPGGEFLPECRAAIVAGVPESDDQTVEVCVLNPTGIFFNTVKFSEDGAPGHWHWPERS